MVRARFCLVGLILATLAFAASARAAEESLHAQIDKLVAAKAPGKPFAPIADDAQFVRRIYLDLAGRIPTLPEFKKFMGNSAADKRTKLIDELLASAEYPQRMQDLFSAMLLERRGDNPEWAKFLRSSFEANKPWDQLTREILDPDAESEATRGAAFFFTKRLEKVGEQETDYPGLTRDIGRLFLGMDLQCAQCHNHLFIDNYKQQDFQGLFIAYQNTFIRNDVKFPAIGEKLINKKLDFMSVFDKEPLSTGPRLPGGKEIEIPAFEKGQEYTVPPNPKTREPGVPKFSAVEALAHEMSTPQNRAFVDNIANRLWFVMMGRGLVNPLDQMMNHVNPPSHPEVLELIGNELAEHKFDMKYVLRELALSEAYQRTSVLPAGEAPPPETYQVAGEKRMNAEQVYNSVLAGINPLGEVAPPADAAAAQAEKDKLRTAFIKAFANPAQDPEVEFTPSLKAALFVLNDALVLDLIAAKPGNLADRLAKQSDPAAVADELYQCVLTRSPSDEEKSAVAEYWKSTASRREAGAANLVWALLASTEFCVNH